ncbi:MAG: YraN family protein [Clostridia bacterium]|nr:YraN family protein [Clostridia bacterium]
MSTTREIGALGEALAAAYLREQGYTVIEQNYYAAHNEIDLIARKEPYLCFIEVKTRRVTEAARYGRPAAAVSYAKQKRLIAAAEQYLRKHPAQGQPRLDVIEVYLPDGIPHPERAERIIHMPGAFYRR